MIGGVDIGPLLLLASERKKGAAARPGKNSGGGRWVIVHYFCGSYGILV